MQAAPGEAPPKDIDLFLTLRHLDPEGKEVFYTGKYHYVACSRQILNHLVQGLLVTLCHYAKVRSHTRSMF